MVIIVIHYYYLTVFYMLLEFIRIAADTSNGKNGKKRDPLIIENELKLRQKLKPHFH